MNINVEVISDVICPWCYIGKRRMEKSIAALDGQHDVLVHWHPFQLNPTMPKQGISRKEYRTKKFGSWETSLDLDAKVFAVGDSEGIQFDFKRIERTPNTVDAHRLIWLGDQHDCQDAVVEALFRAYFCEGREIGSQRTLIELAAESGLDRQTVETTFSGNVGMEAIAIGQDRSQQHNVTSVPFFIVNNAMTLSGAQTSETFVDLFNQAII